LFIASNETLNIIRSENDSIGSSYHEISGRFTFAAERTQDTELLVTSPKRYVN
jgi:hypothetical protein